MKPRIRPNVLKMVPYAPGKPVEEVKRELGLDRVIKLASNENPLGPSPKAMEAVRRAAERMHIYPDGAAFELKQAIARKFGVSPSQVLAGNGSDELLHLIGLLFLGPEDEMIVADPSFSRFDASAGLAPCRLVKVPVDRDFRHDLSAMAAAISPATKLVFIANPNNPTGTIVHKPEVDAFIRDLPAHVTLVLDEAYYEFASDVTDLPCSIDYLKAGHNVIGLRTFSKAYGMAGIRIGYGFAPETVADAIDRAREPFDVNSLAQAAAIAALDDDEHLQRTLDNNRRGLDQLRKAFLDVGARPMESYANFMFADLGRPAKPVFEALLRRGVITRSGHALGSDNCLRVTVGTEEELAIFARELKEVLAPVAV